MEDRQLTITGNEEPIEGVVIDSLVDLTKQTISSVIARRAELKDRQDQLKEELMKNPQYRSAAEAAKEANKFKAEAKKRAMAANTDAARIDAEIKEIRHELKDKQLSLFGYLFEYHNITKATEIEDATGEKHYIQIEAKIKI